MGKTCTCPTCGQAASKDALMRAFDEGREPESLQAALTATESELERARRRLSLSSAWKQAAKRWKLAAECEADIADAYNHSLELVRRHNRTLSRMLQDLRAENRRLRERLGEGE